MWNRRKEEEVTPKPSIAPPSNAALAREGIPMNTLPPRDSGPDGSRGASATIGKSVVIKGQLHSREDLYIDGEVEGSVELQETKLTVGPNGKVKAGVKAREVVVLGTIHGNVDAGSIIEIRKGAHLVGDLRTDRIVIEDGAYFKGSIDIVRTEVPKGQPAPRPQPAAAPAVSAAPAAPAEAKR